MFSLKNALIPLPQQVVDYKKEITIGTLSKADFYLSYDCIENDLYNEAVCILKKKITDISAILADEANGSYQINLSVNKNDEKFSAFSKAESYYIETTENSANLCGYDAAGAYYAVVTFSSLLHINNENLCLPSVYILDYPDFSKRGQFIECRWGSDFMTLDDWKKAIDYISFMKFNHLTIGLYGCWNIQYDNIIAENQFIPFKKYPELKTPKDIKYYSVKDRKWIYKKNVLPIMYSENYFGELIAYAKRKNIKVIPLFNSLGHNTLIPTKFPEVSAKDVYGNPKNAGFCTRNPKTYELLFDLYDKIIDRYLLPNRIDEIEIGLDEVSEIYRCKCESCKDTSYAELMTDFIIKLCKHLKTKGMKSVYIYHDMLFFEFNIINEELRQRFIDEDIYDVVVLDWWSYEDPSKLFFGRTEEVNNLFRSIMKPDTGYYHWAIPTDNNENIRACAKLAVEKGFEGIESYSSFEYCFDKNYLTLAETAWNTKTIDDYNGFELRYAARYYDNNISHALSAFNAMHEIMIDEQHKEFINRILSSFEYYFYSYCFENKEYPQNFPGNAFKLLLEDNSENNYISYLETIRQKANMALKFFSSPATQQSHINDIWKIAANQYYVLCDEYLSLYYMYNSYTDGTSDEFALLSEIERLILQRENLMLMAENNRIEANAIMYLRNMTIFRQYLIDLRNYIKKSISSGTKPEFKLDNLNYTSSDIFYFLR